MFSPHTYLNIQTIHLYKHVVFKSSGYTHIEKNKNATIANVIPKTFPPWEIYMETVMSLT